MPTKDYADALTIEPVRIMRNVDILKCPFVIMVPDHYRANGSCLCDDAEHRKMMVAEWDYTEQDFVNIPLRESK